MKIAVLPLNAAEGTPPAYGRQISAFAGETLRNATGVEQERVQVVSYLAQIEQDGQPRAAFVNISEGLIEYQMLEQLFTESGVDRSFDGRLERTEGGFKMTYRFHEKGNETPLIQFDEEFPDDQIFDQLRLLIARLAEHAALENPASFEFGTDNASSFLGFLEGYDSFNYVNQSNGMVAQEFSPKPAYDALLAAVEADPDFLAPYETLCALTRTCARFQLGTLQDAEGALQKLDELVPDDFRASYSLGEIYGQIGAWNLSADLYEKTLRLHEGGKAKAQEEGRVEDWLLEQASIYSRLGVAQMNQGMPVNAELNFKKAIEMEGEDKPSLNLLANVLMQTNRGHEVPALWKNQMDRQPENGAVRANYAIALLQNEREQEAAEVFEKGLTELEDNLYIKRFYAPYLRDKGDVDRAMDFYEDCIDAAPNDISLLIEYAQTLQRAERDFEIPAVLDNVLASNPDPNTRAQVLAWKIELTEPKRAEAVANAEEKLNRGDFDGVIRELRPLRNWMADYWKLWLLLASAHNRLNQPEDAQEAAERLLGLFPGCEPGYAELMAALSQKNEFEQAYNVMRYAMNQIPGSLGIALNLALAAKRAGHHEEAAQLTKQLREVVGNNPDLDQIFKELEG